MKRMSMFRKVHMDYLNRQHSIIFQSEPTLYRKWTIDIYNHAAISLARVLETD